MKFLLCLFTCLLLNISCGKEAKTKERIEKGITPSEAELYFNTLEAVKKAVLSNDPVGLDRAFLNDPGIDLDQILDDGDTFLIFAIKNDFEEIRDTLIDHGASIEKTNVMKETPLIAAVMNDRESSVQKLLKLKVDLEKEDLQGNTALIISIKNSRDDLSMLLLKQGANPTAMDRLGNDAYKLASERPIPKTLEFMKNMQELEAGAPTIGTYRNILSSGDYLRLSNFLNKYPRLAYDDVYQAINPLVILVELNNEMNALTSAKLLLDYQIDVNGPKNSTEIPLIHAVLAKKNKFAELFLQNGASVEKTDKNGKTALIHAVEINDLDLVAMLVNYKAEKEYDFRKDGQRFRIDVCDTVESVGEKLESTDEKSTNARIKKLLDCGFYRYRWSF